MCRCISRARSPSSPRPICATTAITGWNRVGGARLLPEVEPARDGVIHNCHQEPREYPAHAVDHPGIGAVPFERDRRCRRYMLIDIFAHASGQRGIIDPQHDLEVEMEDRKSV